MASTSTAISKYAKTGCNDTCGKVTIPYPFGIGADCSLNDTCGKVTIPYPWNSNLTMSIDLGKSPFLIDY
ncbi:hypothetical protein Hanom_Chr12g01168581 [Helianthus anomalus]